MEIDGPAVPRGKVKRPGMEVGADEAHVVERYCEWPTGIDDQDRVIITKLLAGLWQHAQVCSRDTMAETRDNVPKAWLDGDPAIQIVPTYTGHVQAAGQALVALYYTLSMTMPVNYEYDEERGGQIVPLAPLGYASCPTIRLASVHGTCRLMVMMTYYSHLSMRPGTDPTAPEDHHGPILVREILALEYWLPGTGGGRARVPNGHVPVPLVQVANWHAEDLNGIIIPGGTDPRDDHVLRRIVRVLLHQARPIGRQFLQGTAIPNSWFATVPEIDIQPNTSLIEGKVPVPTHFTIRVRVGVAHEIHEATGAAVPSLCPSYVTGPRVRLMVKADGSGRLETMCTLYSLTQPSPGLGRTGHAVSGITHAISSLQELVVGH